MQGLTVEQEHKREARRARILELCPDGVLRMTLADVAGKLGASIPTARKDVNALALAGKLQRLPRGLMISAGVKRSWDGAEDRREIHRQRALELGLGTEIRPGPEISSDGQRRFYSSSEGLALRGRFSADRKASWAGPQGNAARSRQGSSQAFAALRAGNKRARDLLAEAKALGLMDQAGLGAALPLGLRRSRAAVATHLATAEIEPVCAVLGVCLYGPEELERLRRFLVDHPDGRLRRFNTTGPANRPFRAVWYLARWRSSAEFGRLAALIAEAEGKRPGPSVMLTAQQETRIDELRSRGGSGASVRAIAQNLALPKGRVERYLRRKVSRNPL